MSQITYFEGKKPIDEKNLYVSISGKVIVDLKTEEEWVEKVSDEGACGSIMEGNFKRTYGITIKDLTTLESTLGYKFGLKDVWELSAGLKGTIGREISRAEASEDSINYQESAPPEGRLFFQILQLRRIYTFIYKNDRFFRLRPRLITHSEFEYLNKFCRKRTILKPYPDPACRPPKDTSNQGFLKGMLSMVTGNLFSNVETYEKDGKLEVPSLGLTVEGKNAEDLVGQQIEIERDRLPSYVSILAGGTGSKLTGSVTTPQTEYYPDKQRYRQRNTESGIEILAVTSALAVGFGIERLLRQRTMVESRTEERTGNSNLRAEAVGLLSAGKLLTVGVIIALGFIANRVFQRKRLSAHKEHIIKEQIIDKEHIIDGALGKSAVREKDDSVKVEMH